MAAMRNCGALARWALACAAVAIIWVPVHRAQDLSSVCAHENLPSMEGGSQEIQDGETVYREIDAEKTHRYFHRNFNVTTMNQPDKYRKLMINLEPCFGVVYLFVRKTRRCYPDPYSCIDTRPGFESRNPAACKWTHFMSEIDGSRDGTPTFFEVPLSSTKYFISVYSTTNRSKYTLTVLADIGAFPRPGNQGRISAMQLRELAVQLEWDEATYSPVGISKTRQYWVYSSMLLDNDNRSNMAVFLRPDKIMNTVCGLKNNTDRHYDRVPAASCINGKCTVTVDGVITDKRYVFNIVAESERGFMMAYSGLVMRTQWSVVRQATDDKTLRVVGIVAGCVLAIVVTIYFLMLKLYG
mmetsp:Transcript_88290/g.248625  ORF Transcript_88290/g.248625 Transcript_88290/m.248625 type:complete len:354 (+) Transcript_88290:52-1113(+)